MLEGQNGGRNQYGCLFAIQAGFKCSANGHFRFTKSYIAANQSVHRTFTFHILLNICSCFALIGCVFVNKGGFQFVLHVVIGTMRKSLLGFALGV